MSATATRRADSIPEVRNVRFALTKESRPRYWYGGRRSTTIFFNNLSIFFPEGEAFFVRSVRRFAHLVQDPVLREQVKAFCGQEGIHTREHVRYNALLAAQGYRSAELERRVERLLGLVMRAAPARWQLAATACLEHFTATMALFVLGRREQFANADPVLSRLWEWHAAEEFEHRTVAFDVYELAGGNYVERTGVMLLTSLLFWAKVVEQQVALMRDDGLALDAHEWRDLVHSLVVEPGVLRHVARSWVDWFRPGFHPRQVGGAELLRDWRRSFEARYGAAAMETEPLVREHPEVETAIVGTGFSGLGMAIRLKQENRGSFVVLEKGDEVGGTWRENRYPGCACDVPSHVYSFSFEPNARWSREYASQPEILEYLKGCADRHGLRSKVRFKSELVSARFDEERSLWRLETRSGDKLTARHLVLGLGALHRPSFPAIAGAERFQGKTFHSAEWDAHYDLRGKSVAVIGTGASAIQFVPRIAPLVAHLDLYQRTPPWVMPFVNRDLPEWEKRLFETLPLLRILHRARIFGTHELRSLGFTKWPVIMKALEWIGKAHLRRQVSDPVLRDKLTPRYVPGCKRILISNDYYPAVARSNVSLVTDGIREITERGVVTADGREREVDAIIYGTGFKVTEPPARGFIVGRGGRDLADVWGERIEAHLGTTVSGFPNLYHLMGPNTGLGHNSMVFMIESQIEHVLDLVRAADRRGALAVEVKPEAQRAYNDSLAGRLKETVWGSGCRSWYLDRNGHNATTWPGSTIEFWWRARGACLENYQFS